MLKPHGPTGRLEGLMLSANQQAVFAGDRPVRMEDRTEARQAVAEEAMAFEYKKDR